MRIKAVDTRGAKKIRNFNFLLPRQGGAENRKIFLSIDKKKKEYLLSQHYMDTLTRWKVSKDKISHHADENIIIKGIIYTQSVRKVRNHRAYFWRKYFQNRNLVRGIGILFKPSQRYFPFRGHLGSPPYSGRNGRTYLASKRKSHYQICHKVQRRKTESEKSRPKSPAKNALH